MRIKGLDDLEKRLKKMEQGAKELERTKSVSFGELFNDSFMRKNTQFGTIEEFMAAGGFNVETEEEFEAIPDEDMNRHVAKTTNFKDWESMLGTAGTDYAAKKLGF